MYTLEDLADILELEKEKGFRLQMKEVQKGKFKLIEKRPYFRVYVELECNKRAIETVRSYTTRFRALMQLIDGKRFDDLKVYYNTIDLTMSSFSRDLFTKGIALLLNAPDVEFVQIKAQNDKKIDKLSKKYILLSHVEAANYTIFYGIRRQDLSKYLKREPEPTFTCVFI